MDEHKCEDVEHHREAVERWVEEHDFAKCHTCESVMDFTSGDVEGFVAKFKDGEVDYVNCLDCYEAHHEHEDGCSDGD